MLERISLVAFRRAVITPDMAEGIRQLELRARTVGNIRLSVEARPPALDWAQAERSPGLTGSPPPASMWVAGREARLRIKFLTRQASRWEEIAMLWGLAVPLGFTPWDRYPMPSKTDEVFHYLGPWQSILDHLSGEGRGEVAWPSMCSAAQVDIGRWQGDKPVERFIQSQLYRLGQPCGPIDGEIGARTLSAMRVLGLQGVPLDKAAEYLLAHDPPEPTEAQRQVGYISAPGHKLAINTTGKVYSTTTRTGAALTIDGPGRIIVDVS